VWRSQFCLRRQNQYHAVFGRAGCAKAALGGRKIDAAAARAGSEAATVVGARPLRNNAHKLLMLAIPVRSAVLQASGASDAETLP
jgi:hypothetical protein